MEGGENELAGRRGGGWERAMILKGLEMWGGWGMLSRIVTGERGQAS